MAASRPHWVRSIASLLENKKHEIFYSLDSRSTLNSTSEVGLDAILMDLEIAKSSLSEIKKEFPGLIVAVWGNLPYSKGKKIESSDVKYFERVGAGYLKVVDYLEERLKAAAHSSSERP